MARLKRLALTNRLVSFDPLLAKTDGFDLIALLSDHDVGLSWMRRGALGLVVPRHPALASRGSFSLGITGDLLAIV